MTTRELGVATLAGVVILMTSIGCQSRSGGRDGLRGPVMMDIDRALKERPRDVSLIITYDMRTWDGATRDMREFRGEIPPDAPRLIAFEAPDIGGVGYTPWPPDPGVGVFGLCPNTEDEVCIPIYQWGPFGREFVGCDCHRVPGEEDDGESVGRDSGTLTFGCRLALTAEGVRCLGSCGRFNECELRWKSYGARVIPELGRALKLGMFVCECVLSDTPPPPPGG